MISKAVQYMLAIGMFFSITAIVFYILLRNNVEHPPSCEDSFDCGPLSLAWS